jgi:hypothetical protein
VPGRSKIEMDDVIAVHARPSSFHFFDQYGRKISS